MKPFLYKVAGAIAGFTLGAVVGVTGLVLYIFGSHDPDLDAELDSWDWDDDEAHAIASLSQEYLDLMETGVEFHFVGDTARDEAWWASLIAEGEQG